MSDTDRPAPPVYIDSLISDFSSGSIGRYNHLGHWDGASGTSLADAQQRMNDVLVDLAEVRSGMTVLDAGCGFGGSLESINSDFDHMALVGLDVDHRQLRTCAQIAPGATNSLAWVSGDACELPFPERTFDRVLSIEAMWHFPSRRRFLAEAARVVRDDGIVVAVDILIRPGAPERVGMDESELADTLRQGFAPWPEPFMRLEQVLDVAESAGLACIATVDATQETKRTYQDHHDVDDRPGAAAFSANPSVGTFVELHRRDLLQVVYLCWRRRAR